MSSIKSFVTNMISAPNGLGVGIKEGDVLTITSEPATADLTCVIYQNPSMDQTGSHMRGNVIFVSQANPKTKTIKIRIKRYGYKLSGQTLGLHLLAEPESGGQVFNEYTFFHVF